MNKGGRERNALNMLHGRDRRGRGGRQQTKNREMEKKDAGREQEKVKWGGRGWAGGGSVGSPSPVQWEGAGKRVEEQSEEERAARALRDRPARPSEMKIS